MSSFPFDSSNILKWFSMEELNNVPTESSSGAGNILIEAKTPKVPPTVPEKDASDSTNSMNALSSVPVLVGTGIVQLPVPIDLLCALLLTNTKPAASHFLLEEVLQASENLKRFRDVATSPSVVSAANASLVPTPVLSSVLSDPSTTDVASSPSVNVVAMSLDQNGAPVVQEMIMKASEFEKDIIFSQLASAMVLISINTHGCRVVQRALEYGNHEQNERLFLAIPVFKIVDLCIDVNGNHVMQKFVDSLPQSALHEIVMSITEDPATVARLSLHSYGCRVVQRLLVRCTAEDRSSILNFVITTFPDLVCDQFGNYVAQHSLEYSSEEEKKAILATLTLMDAAALCCNKFASNVIEKAIRVRLIEKTVLHRLIDTIVQTEEALLSLMKDKYGNYVVKAICDLSVVDFPEVIYVKNVLIANAAALKKYTYGFHLVEKLERGAAGGRGRTGSGYSESSSSRGRGFAHM